LSSSGSAKSQLVSPYVCGKGGLIKISVLFDQLSDHQRLKDCPLALISGLHSYRIVFCAVPITGPSVLSVSIIQLRNCNSEFQSNMFA
jgi:hypothetical protein